MEWVTRERNKVFECNFSYLKEISDRGRGACRVGTCSEPDLGIHRGQSSTHTNRETPQGPLVKHRGQRTEPLLFDDITGPVESCANPLRKVRRLPTVQSPRPNQRRGMKWEAAVIYILMSSAYPASVWIAKARQKPPMWVVADCVCHRVCSPDSARIQDAQLNRGYPHPLYAPTRPKPARSATSDRPTSPSTSPRPH